MKETCKKYVEEVNELTELCIKVLAPDVVKTSSPDELALVQKMLGLIKTSNGLVIKQAFLIDDMNAKIDILLKNQRKES